MFGGAWFYDTQREQARARVGAELGAIARLKVEQIVAWRFERLGDAGTLADSPLFIRSVARWLANPRGRLPEETLALLSAMRYHYKYDDILLVDPAARVRLSLAGASRTLHADAALAVQASLRDGRPRFADFHENGEGYAHLCVVAPLRVGRGDTSRPVGAVILVSDPRVYLYPLIQSWPIPSETAETLLVRRDGDEVLYLNDLRHRPNTSLRLRIPVSQSDVPAVRAVLGAEGIFEGVDYRGERALSALRAIPNSPWFMVAKIDAAEAYAGWRLRAWLILALMLALVVSLGAGGFVVWQRREKAHYRLLYQVEAAQRRSEARHRVTLQSIGDGVIVTDAEGRVELLNPVAEALTGWTGEEACGRPLDEVFRIVSEETGQSVESPAERVVREGRVVGLANHTLLLARDGARRPVADSGAPVRGEDAGIVGVVLVFRDQTDERAAQRALRESELRYHTLADSGQALIWTSGLDKRCTYFNEPWLRFTGRTLEQELGDGWAEGVHPEDLDRCLQGYTAAFDRRERFSMEYRLRHTSGEYRWILDDGAPRFDSQGTFLGYIGHCLDITERKRVESERERLQAQLLQAQKMEAVGRLAGGIAHDFNNLLMGILNYTELAEEALPAEHPARAFLTEIRADAERSANLTRQLLGFARRQTAAPRVLDLNETVAGMLRLLRRLIGEDIDLAWLPGGGLGRVKIDPSQVDQILANLAVNARDAIRGPGRITIETENSVIDAASCAQRPDFSVGAYVCLAVSDTGHGMDAATQARLFEPYFTTKELGQGTGLGLATVYGIVKQNGGFINVYSEPGRGTTFRIYLPRVAAAAASAAPDRPPAIPRGRGETILVVEDEKSIRTTCGLFLADLGYTVLTAECPAEALDRAATHAGPLHLLLTDVILPGMTGRALAMQLTARTSGLKVLYMSGYTADAISHQGVLEDGLAFLQKPFTRGELAAKVRAVLDDAAPGGEGELRSE